MLKQIIFLLAMTFALNLNAQYQCSSNGQTKMEVGNDTCHFYFTEQPWRWCFPQNNPEDIMIRWIVSCNGQPNTKIWLSPEDTLSIVPGDATSVFCSIFWAGIGNGIQSPLKPWYGLYGPSDDCFDIVEEMPSSPVDPIPLPVQETWSEDGCITATGPGPIIITLTFDGLPVNVTEDGSHCASPPEFYFYVMWPDPYKVTPLEQIKY